MTLFPKALQIRSRKLGDESLQVTIRVGDIVSLSRKAIVESEARGRFFRVTAVTGGYFTARRRVGRAREILVHGDIGWIESWIRCEDDRDVLIPLERHRPDRGVMIRGYGISKRWRASESSEPKTRRIFLKDVDEREDVNT